MNFSGNITQIMIILFVALLVFGPKKMMEYAYQAGKMLAKFRTMYEQTMTQVQAEMDQAGVGEATKLVNTRVDIASVAENYLNAREVEKADDLAQTATAINASIMPESAPVSAATESVGSDQPAPQPSLNDPETPDSPPTESGRYNEWLPG